MRQTFLPFSRPSITEGDIASVVEVLRSGWITTGKKCQAFEEAFCTYTGCRHAVALSSATGGMHLLLAALDIKEGDEIITPSMTWVSTVNLICLAGATPVFADIDRDSLMVTARTIEPCLSPRTRLIIPVHFAGASLDLDPIREIGRIHTIPVAEDAAHSLGTRYGSEPIGKTGTSIFSFHPIKAITTGEGGMFCSDDQALADRVRRLKFHGLGVDAYDRTMQGRSPQAQVIEPGYKYNLPDMAAALGLSQLMRVDEMNGKRRALALRYLELLSDVDEIRPLAVPPDPDTHAWHLFIVRLDTRQKGLDRDRFINELKARNIGAGIHFRAVHSQSFYAADTPLAPGGLSNTDWNSERIFSLPLFPDMSLEDVADVVHAIKEILVSVS